MTVIINDNISPNISFVNKSSSNGGNNLILNLALLDNFNILNDDIIFSKNENIDNSNNLPYIKYSDNSLYNGNLNYNIETSNNITFIGNNTIKP